MSKLEVVIPEKIKGEFDEWQRAKYKPLDIWDFSRRDFTLRQGVYLSFLRERGVDCSSELLTAIVTNESPVKNYYAVAGNIAYGQRGEINLLEAGDRLDAMMFGLLFSDYNTALTHAINKGFQILNEGKG